MTFYEVWKVPATWDTDEHDPWAKRGIFPRGSRLATCRTEAEAEEIKETLEESSPSERFGESMDEAPYKFVIGEREFEEDKGR